jgi:cellulose biosynthesis protein BcsQ
MKSVCFFNNKGGVGKTTLACNVAAHLAREHDHRVVLIDADPQGNATQLIVAEADLDSFYRRHMKSGSRVSRKQQAITLFDVLQPIAAGEPTIHEKISPLKAVDNRFDVDLIPGHPEVALLEDKLSQAWLSFGGGDVGGARITNWSTQLNGAIDLDYDIAVYDVGPSLGALNRSVLVGADYFVTPMGCDIFSLMGVTNIAGWLKKWLAAYVSAIEKCKQTWDIDEFPIRTDANAMARFVGYTVQQYIAKSKEGKRRATKAYERILAEIPPTVTTELGQFVAPHINPAALRLPDVPHMYSLVPLAQSANAPIDALESADGLVGTQYVQKGEYAKFIRTLSASILGNLDLAD